MRAIHRLSLLGALVVAFWGAVSLTSGRSAVAVEPLLPDLRTLPPSDLQFDTVTFADGTVHRVLRLANTVGNYGRGPVEIQGTIETGTGFKAVQNIYNSDGTKSSTGPLSGFEYHAEHKHWHYKDFASYVLLEKVGGSYVETTKKGTKTGFCLLDTTRVQRLPGAPTQAVYRQCGTLDAASTSVIQGISVGWGDTYRASLAEQWVDLEPLGGTGYLPDGEYAIRSTVDPTGKLTESDTTNNTATTYFRVTGGRIRVQR